MCEEVVIAVEVKDVIVLDAVAAVDGKSEVLA